MMNQPLPLFNLQPGAPEQFPSRTLDHLEFRQPLVEARDQVSRPVPQRTELVKIIECRSANLQICRIHSGNLISPPGEVKFLIRAETAVEKALIVNRPTVRDTPR